ncbi:carboxymuconolactone decarboxylase family protein [Pandoraea sp.]|uniref:carboxymuconolactone decarboxylase family protein n=1 Tax=Pandoraea sp. TaxID=1883445 RepID=UPI0012272CFC|nr:carboxymuconolactone decarboxylase family protein [Pandoraea sp.]TAL53007.1 MAG: carboxymuconolactone decarboxylase family protein [Pandoraea sp.]TAM18753.1 MAG: carboxymuconolactone decarboxylase family protein [Pandoraea sp.]
MKNVAKLELAPHSLDTAQGRTKEVLDIAMKQTGMIPNMYANMSNSPGLLETYLFGYNLFRKESDFTPAEQEVVFLTISRLNECTYCMAAHSMIAEVASKTPAQAIAALRDDKPIEDPKLRALSAFTRVMVESRGRPTPDDVRAFTAVGYSERQVLEIILAMAVKTISNYSNHVFHTEVDSRFAGHAWQPQTR